MRKVQLAVLFLCFIFLPKPASALSWDSVLTFVNTMQGEVSAWAVSVKQTAVVSNQITDSEIASKQQLATAIGAIDMSNRVMTSVVSFDANVGQPNSIKCVAQQSGKLHVEADAQRMKDTSHLMSSYAGNRVGSKVIADTQILGLHRDRYCSVSEARQGMCHLFPNGMQGWDVNYAGFASEKTLAPEGELAGYAYAAMISDTRAEAVIDCENTACAAAQAEQLSQAAISGMAANSIVGQVTDRRVPMLTGQ